MRRVRDRHLPDPFRRWADRGEPLPPGVIVLPRTVDVLGNLMGVAQVGLGCVGMGWVTARWIVPSTDLTRPGNAALLALFWCVLLALLGWFARKLWSAVGARRDRGRGRLRQGVLVGREGVLVRLSPDRCYAVRMDRFVRAEEWTNGSEDSPTYVRIVTRDGPIDFADADLTAGAAEVNHAVAAARGLPDESAAAPGPARDVGPKGS